MILMFRSLVIVFGVTILLITYQANAASGSMVSRKFDDVIKHEPVRVAGLADLLENLNQEINSTSGDDSIKENDEFSHDLASRAKEICAGQTVECSRVLEATVSAWLNEALEQFLESQSARRRFDWIS